MRVRKLDANGDMVYGGGATDFLVNSPETVRQCILTALKLWQGEWFLDMTAGVPWNTQVLGSDTQPLYDSAIQTAIRGVQGVVAIESYASSLDRTTRTLTVTATIITQFGNFALESAGRWKAPPTTGYGITPPTGPYGG